MSDFLTPSSTLMCPHGGTVSATASQQKATAGDAILVSTDTCTIAGCPFVIGLSPHPCVTVQWIVPAVRVTCGGTQALTKDSVGLCLAGDQAPQGTVLVAATQPRASGL